jgi:hypothetical protein
LALLLIAQPVLLIKQAGRNIGKTAEKVKQKYRWQRYFD